ncbi:MAG: immunoglobulin-like domain-containing protein, partial [Candidatus Hydrogenedens sp.]
MIKNRLDSMFIMLVLTILIAVAMPAQSVVYVDKMAPRPGGVEDGLSWATAFDTIQEGIDLATAYGGDDVWVAGGPGGGGYVYDEIRTIPWGFPASVDGSLILEDNVHLYGGFEGYWGIQETSVNQRNPRLAKTIIDGSRSRGGLQAYHVIVVGKQSDPMLNVRIDGFQITGGNASGVAGDYHTWRGGGLFNWAGQVIVVNCTFIDNVAAVSGGAIANERNGAIVPQLTIQNCVFYQNSAKRQLDTSSNPIRGGGAFFSNQADVTIAFSTFVDNTVNTSTGGLYGLNSGGFFGFNTTNASKIDSCIFWNNTPAMASCLEVVCSGGAPPGCGLPAIVNTNILQNQDPLFATAPPEFELQPVSPFIDAGSTPYPTLSTDIRMISRPQNAGNDRGAYETVTLPMTAVCRNDQSVSLDNTGNASAPAVNFADLVNSIVPGGLWRVKVSGLDKVNFDCSMYPSTTITVRLIENTGRWAECNATVTVNDPIAPTAVCKDITVYLNNLGTYTLNAGEINNGSSDNCSVNLSIPPTTFTCTDAGSTIPVTLTATDPAGNSDQCVGNVTVQDNLPPTVITKQITVQLDATGNASIVPADVNNGSSDNCGIANMSLDKSTFTCADVPSVLVNLTVTDVNGNSNSAPALVIVQDSIPPNVVTQDITVQLDNSGQVTILPDDIDNGSSDNCSIDHMEVDPSTLTCADLGTAVVDLVVYDVNGNIGTAPATITVQDNIAPMVNTKDVTLYLNASGQLTVLPSDVDDGSYDNCPIDHMEVTPNTFNCGDIGSHVVTLTVYDPAGNSSSDTATVTVEDNMPPTVITKNITIDLDADGNASIVPVDVDNGSSDNCGIDHLELDKASFTCADLGGNIVNLTVYDVNGNSASASATVTVRDVTAPVITVTGNEEIWLKIMVDCYTEEGAVWADACDGTGPAIIGGDTAPTNCPLQESDLGDYVITYDYTDSSGNSAIQKTRTIHVIRNYPPEITLLGDNPMTLSCKEPYNEPGYTATDVEDGDLTSEVIVTGDVDTFTPGTYIIEYKVTDHDLEYPMTTTEYRTVNVVDNDLPVLTMEGPVLLAWQLGEPWVDPGYTAEDYCWGDVTDLVEINGVVDVNTPGSYLLTYTPKDGSGNSGESKERTVYVGNLLQIVEHPYDVDAYTDGNTFELSVTFTGGIFIPGYDTYLWYRNSDIVNSGVLESGMNTIELVVDPSALSPGTYGYHAELTDVESVHLSGTATVRIANHITITGDIFDSSVVMGQNYSMTVLATGGIGTLHYQWQKQTEGKAWENLTDIGNISGTNTNTLVFTPFEEGDGGQYRCLINDDYLDMIYS